MNKRYTTLVFAWFAFLFISNAQDQHEYRPQAFPESQLSSNPPLEVQAFPKQVVNTSDETTNQLLQFSADSSAIAQEQTKKGQAALRRGQLLWEQGLLEPALLNLREAEQILKAEDQLKALMELYQLLALIHEQEENYPAALAYVRQFAQVQRMYLSTPAIARTTALSVDEAAKIDSLKRETNLRVRQLGFAILAGSILLAFMIVVYRQSLQNRRLAEDLEGRVRQRTKNLEESNQALQRFAYIASHDLKTPLRTIVSLLSLIRRKIRSLQDTELEELIQMTTAGAKQMTDMIESILTFARINSSIQPMPREHVQLDSVVESVKEKIGRINTDRPMRIQSSSLPAVSGNNVKLYQLFQNLITNGLKYNTSKFPTVKIRALNQSGDYYLLQVSDNGIGIPEEFRTSVFDMFKRLHSSSAYEGTGIGLALCKVIVEQHGGRIWIEGNPEGGTSFLFTLPKT